MGDLHTVLCTMELPLARWADSVCVTTIVRTAPLTLSMHQLNEISEHCQRVKQQRCPERSAFSSKTADLIRDRRIDNLLKDFSVTGRMQKFQVT